jgi:hypothetical protein
MSGPARLDPDRLAALEDQRDFLLRSLEDLDRERAAGDLDDADHATLRDEYTARAAEILRAIDEERDAFEAAKRPRDPRRTAAVVGAVAVFAVVAGLLVAQSLGARGAGDTLSGGIGVSQSPSQRAQGCIGELQGDGVASAVECFQGVLADDPRNVVALTWLGWTLELGSAGLPEAEAAELSDSAADLVERAVEADPSYSYARAFRVVLAFRRGDLELAETYLGEFRAGNPSPDAQAVIDSFEIEQRIAEGLEAEAGGDEPSATDQPVPPPPVEPVPTAPGADTDGFGP